TEVFIPTPAAGTKMGWTKLKDRQVYDFALTSVAVVFTANGATWSDGRVVLGGVSPVPYRAKVVEDAIKGKDIKSSISAAAAQIRTVARPISLNAYKVETARGLVGGTVLQPLGWCPLAQVGRGGWTSASSDWHAWHSPRRSSVQRRSRTHPPRS